MSSNNLFQIAHDDELLDALGARQRDASVEAAGRAGDQSYDALAADLDAWVRAIDADVDAAGAWTSALGGASRVTLQDGADVERVAGAAGATASTSLSASQRVVGHGGAYSASRGSMLNRVVDARRERRGARRHSWKAGAAAVSVGAALSLSGVAAAVSGGKIDTLGPLDLRWSSAVNEPATIAGDVPAAKATDSGVPTVPSAQPTIEARSGADAARRHGGSDLPPRATTTRSDEGSPSERQTSDWPSVTQRRPGLAPATTARPALPSTRRPNGSWSTASRPSATSKPSTGASSSSKPSRPTKPSGSGSSSASPTSSPTSKPSTPGTKPTSPSSRPTSPSTSPTSGTTGTGSASSDKPTGSSSGQAASSRGASSATRSTSTRTHRHQGSGTARVGASPTGSSATSSSALSASLSAATLTTAIMPPTVTTATSE